jgi:hypothetical protein
MSCKLELCTRPCQMGKTEDILNNMVLRYHETNEANEGHLLELVVTNKSLVEVKQWSERLNNKFHHFPTNIFSLSSKSKDFKKADELIAYFTKVHSQEEYPNIVIMCFHDTRVCKDIVELIDVFSNRPIFAGFKIRFSITFDEPDVNMGTTSKFLELSKDFIGKGNIERITFVTATPEETFWKALGKHKIYELENINRGKHTKFEEDLANYRSVEDHEFELLDLITPNPLDYVMEIYAGGLIDETNPVIVFAPAHSYKYTPDVGCHGEFETFFLSRGYGVLLINGDFKGFKYPKGKRQSIDEYRQKFGLSGELRDILRHWKVRHPKRNLAITGNAIIERGITFNTDGFNFTHAIFSSYHKANKSRLVQMVGRTCGNINFVDPIKIICPTDIKNIVSEFFRMQIEVNMLNPDVIQKTNFIDTEKTIPVKLEFTEEVLKEIVEIRGANLTSSRKRELNTLINTRIASREIKMFDKNNINRLDLNKYSLGSCRIYKDGHSVKARRFPQLNKCFDENTPYCLGSTIETEGNKYVLDIAENDYEFEGVVYPKTVGWITFKK